MEYVSTPFPGYRLLPQYQYLISAEPSGAGRIVTDHMGRPSNYILGAFYLGSQHPTFSDACAHNTQHNKYPGKFSPAQGY